MIQIHVLKIDYLLIKAMSVKYWWIDPTARDDGRSETNKIVYDYSFTCPIPKSLTLVLCMNLFSPWKAVTSVIFRSKTQFKLYLHHSTSKLRIGISINERTLMAHKHTIAWCWKVEAMIEWVWSGGSRHSDTIWDNKEEWYEFSLGQKVTACSLAITDENL